MTEILLRTIYIPVYVIKFFPLKGCSHSDFVRNKVVVIITFSIMHARSCSFNIMLYVSIFVNSRFLIFIIVIFN